MTPHKLRGKFAFVPHRLGTAGRPVRTEADAQSVVAEIIIKRGRIPIQQKVGDRRPDQADPAVADKSIVLPVVQIHATGMDQHDMGVPNVFSGKVAVFDARQDRFPEPKEFQPRIGVGPGDQFAGTALGHVDQPAARRLVFDGIEDHRKMVVFLIGAHLEGLFPYGRVDRRKIALRHCRIDLHIRLEDLDQTLHFAPLRHAEIAGKAGAADEVDLFMTVGGVVGVCLVIPLYQRRAAGRRLSLDKVFDQIAHCKAAFAERLRPAAPKHGLPVTDVRPVFRRAPPLEPVVPRHFVFATRPHLHAVELHVGMEVDQPWEHDTFVVHAQDIVLLFTDRRDAGDPPVRDGDDPLL